MDALDDQIIRSLRRISRAIDKHSHRLAETWQLTGPQLLCIRRLAVGEDWTPSRLAAEIAVSQPTVTGIVTRLEKRGLLRRTRDDADRRRVWLELTPEGRALAERAPSPLQDQFATRLKALEPDEQRRIADVLAEVVEMMEAEELDASPLLATGPLDATPSDVLGLLESD